VNRPLNGLLIGQRNRGFKPGAHLFYFSRINAAQVSVGLFQQRFVALGK
jgi:hypothetical protein